MSQDEALLQKKVDITSCEREPIHIPGSIQPHGVLLALREPDLTIVQVSDNTSELLGLAAEALLHKSLDALVDDGRVEELRKWLGRENIQFVNPIKIQVKTGKAGETGQEGQERVFDGVLHRSDGLLVLELEPTETHQPDSFPSFYHSVRAAVARLQEAETLYELCQAAAEEVRRLTGFDRVMIYQFDKHWNGEVVAEAKQEGLEPYLGLHYPASDIPVQARELYRRNWLRLIADVNYRPAPIVPVDNPLTGRPLDLSFSALRSVSPMHIEYLKNMGVQASMSVSIIKNDQLWGLISCHHQTPKYVSYEVRTTCEFFGQILSSQLAVKEDFSDYAYEMQVKDIQAALLERLLREEQFEDALLRGEPSLLDLVNAQGAVLYLGDRCISAGEAPQEADVRELVRWLQERMGDEPVFTTDALPALYPEAERYKDVASGLLAVSLSPLQGHYLLWFRPEVVQTVQWCGDPTKPVEVEQNELRLHPRKSFDLWKQVVRLHSLPWQQVEVAAAFRLRSAITDSMLRSMILRRAGELARLNEELERSNNELDSFAYIASHDLKEPLRGIHNYSLILLEDFADRLGDDGRERLQTLLHLSERMDSLIESLLHYSRVGRVDLAFAKTDLNEVVRQALEILRIRLEETGVEVRIPSPLPAIRCDRVRVGEIFSNLITNAMKYNDKAEKWIEIGFEERAGQPTIFYVRDNGIGIRDKYFDAIFRIFKRLYGRDKYGGGTGAGLTIAKRIVERHGGRIWVESTYGQGSTFYFTLEKEER